MESCLVDVVGDALLVYYDVFLIEDSFVASDKSIYFSVLSKQAVDDVVSSWTLPSIETDSNLDFS